MDGDPRRDRIWSELQCDQHISTQKGDRGTPVTPAVKEEEEKEEEATVRKPDAEVGLPSLSADNKGQSIHTLHEQPPCFNRIHGPWYHPAPGWCRRMRKKYNVTPMKSWGEFPMNMVDEWKNRQCDLVFTSSRMGKKKVSSCPSTNLNESLPLIAVMAATTTRKMSKPSTGSLALFTLLLPSMLRSLDCGFRYEFVLGYDQGDQFFDSEEVIDSSHAQSHCIHSFI